MRKAMVSKINERTIIWAVDPTQSPKDAKNIIKELRTWAKYLDCKVQPVAILSKYLFKFPSEVGFPWKQKFEDVGTNAVNRYLKKAHVEDFLRPQLVFTNTFSNREMAAEMAKFAENKNAAIVFVNSRAKKTWNPFRLGGFAETLLTLSKTPVLVMNPKSKPSEEISTILFPTDFSQDSKNALAVLEPWAKKLNSKILLYNQIEVPNIIYPSEVFEYWQSQALINVESVKDIKKMREKKAKKWAEELGKKKIEVSMVVQRQRQSLSKEIIEAAEKNKCDLVAIESHTGPAARVILGSVAKDVLLQSKCPVLIFYRPKRKKI